MVYSDKDIIIVYNLIVYKFVINCKKEINKIDMKMLCFVLLILVFYLLKRFLKIFFLKRIKNRMDRVVVIIKNRRIVYICFYK